MDAFGAVLSLIFFVLVIYLISKLAHFFNNTRNRLEYVNGKPGFSGFPIFIHENLH